MFDETEEIAKTDIVSVLYDPSVAEIVEASFAKTKSKEQITFEYRDISFRLNKTSKLALNIEHLSLYLDEQTNNSTFYYKPIAYYTIENSQRISCTVLNEFREMHLVLRLLGQGHNFSFGYFSLKVNALCAAFSFEAMNTAMQIMDKIYNSKKRGIFNLNQISNFEKSILSNGFKLDFFINDLEQIQSYLDDIHNFPHGLAVYKIENENFIINPSLDFKDLYLTLHDAEILSAYKVLI